MTVFSANAIELGVHSVEDRAAWLEARRGLVTASDMASLLGHGRTDAFTVFYEKVAPPKDVELDLDDPRLWGSVFELPAAQTLARRLKWAELRPGGQLLQSRHHAGIGSTLDAEIMRTHDEGWITYEGKISQRDDEWDEDEQTLPASFLVQVQTQLFVTRATKGLVFGLIRNSKTKQIVVQPYEPLWETMIGAVDAFLDLVRKGEPPPTTAKSTGALRRLFPEDDGSSVMLPRDALEWTREYQEILRQEKMLTEAKEELKNKLRFILKKSTYGELPVDIGGKGRWQNKVNKSGSRTLTLVNGDERARRNALPLPPAPDDGTRELAPSTMLATDFVGFDPGALPGEVNPTVPRVAPTPDPTLRRRTKARR
jgi:predicted phage-related endonuclease